MSCLEIEQIMDQCELDRLYTNPELQVDVDDTENGYLNNVCTNLYLYLNNS